MRIGDQLLLGLISSNPQVKLCNIMTLICDYLDENNTYPIKRLIGYLLTDTNKIRRPPGCIQIIYKGFRRVKRLWLHSDGLFPLSSSL